MIGRAFARPLTATMTSVAMFRRPGPSLEAQGYGEYRKLFE